MNIYVGNLPYSTTDDELSVLFGEYGQVRNSVIVSDRETGRSRGFGFVELEDEQAGQRAIEELTGSSFQGRPLTINEARNSANRSQSQSYSGGGYGGAGGSGGYRGMYD